MGFRCVSLLLTTLLVLCPLSTARVTFNNINGERRAVNKEGDLEAEMEMPELPEEEDALQFFAMLKMSDSQYFAFTDFLVEAGFKLERYHFRYLEAAFDAIQHAQSSIASLTGILLDSLPREALIRVDHPISEAAIALTNSKDICFQLVHNTSSCHLRANNMIDSTPASCRTDPGPFPESEDIDKEVEKERKKHSINPDSDFSPSEYKEKLLTHHQVIRDNFKRWKAGVKLLKECETGEAEMNWMMLAHREMNKYFVWTDMFYEVTHSSEYIIDQYDRDFMHQHVDDGAQAVLKAMEEIRFLIGKIGYDIMKTAEEDEDVWDIKSGDSKKIFKSYNSAHHDYVIYQRENMKKEFTKQNNEKIKAAQKANKEKEDKINAKMLEDMEGKEKFTSVPGVTVDSKNLKNPDPNGKKTDKDALRHLHTEL